MIKRHADQLWERLDQLYANGTTFISLGEMYHWYNIQRLAKEPWRDLKGKWESLLEEKGAEHIFYPKVANVHGGFSFFYAARSDRLDDLAK